MADSLVFGAIELLGGGAPSVLPGCEGAIIRLGRDYSLSAPVWTSDKVAGLLLAGEQLTPVRASNRTPLIPVVIIVPPTGDAAGDRLTLASARELVMQTATQDQVRLTWTRDGGLPLVLDVEGATATTVEYSVIRERNLCALLEIECEAYPFGHSDTEETIALTSASTLWDPPPAPAVLDDFSAASNFLRGDASTFDGGLGQWQPAVNAALTPTGAQTHAGAGAMLMTATAASVATARHCPAGDPVLVYAMRADPGDVVTLAGWVRAVSATGPAAVGAEFYDGTGTLVGSAAYGTPVTDSAAAWTQATASLTAPDGTVWAVASTQLGTPGAGEAHYWDDVWMDVGVAYSAVSPELWSWSTQTPVTSGHSVRWSRVGREAPTYDHWMAAPVNVSSRGKVTFYAGLATTQTAYPTWNKGVVTFRVSLYDAAGNVIKTSTRRRCHASGLPGVPEWQLITAPLPQVPTGFDYTTVSRYVITAYNDWEGAGGHPVLQAGLFLGLLSATGSSTGTPGLRGLWSTLPGIVGSAPTQLGVAAAPGPGATGTIVEYTTPGTKNLAIPAGIFKLDKVEMVGAGAGGASGQFTSYPYFGGSGGGAGEWSMDKDLAVAPSTTIHPVVGAKGTGGTTASANNATDGGDTYCPGTVKTARAHGGKRGWKTHADGGGKGGDGSVDYQHHPGGDGWPANWVYESTGWAIQHGGGGGGAAGANHDGYDATDYHAAPATSSGGGPGGEGGHIYESPHNGQQPTTGPGGGGGGGSISSASNTATGTLSNWAGADGRDGYMKITYGQGVPTPLTSLLVHMPNPDAPLGLSPVIPVGNGADTPNGSTEYLVPDVGGLKARFDGTYTMFLIGSGTYGAASSLRTVTVQLRQYPYAGGTAETFNVARDFTPSTDITAGWIEMGTFSLPLSGLPAGNTDAYLAVTVTSGQTADRYLDIVLVDTQGSTILFSKASAGYASVWVDAPDRDHDLGMVLGSDADRNRALSITRYVKPWSGGAFTARPNAHNRLLIYSQQGCPAATLVYVPYWLVDRLS